ncbi:MAG: ABC transporter ATP-binding protein [Polyangiaceae bacterium]
MAEEVARDSAGGESVSREPLTLDVSSVWQRYPSKGGHQVVLSDVSLKVPEPQFLTVVGPSGCGKSTLLRLILGSESPWKGAVHAAGREVVHPDRNRGIVFQKYSLFPHLTVLENVMFGLELDGTWLLQKWLTWPWYKQRHKQHQEQAMEYLKTVRLDQHAGKYPHQLSGGMQQRVAIAQAMIMKPAILLMDEPFGALDPGTREDLQLTIIETFEEQKATIFFVTHDLEEALFVGTRLLVLSSFYSVDEGEDAVGSKLVMDIPTPKTPTTADKKRGDFRELIQEVRRQGFDPEYRQHVREFDLRH